MSMRSMVTRPDFRADPIRATGRRLAFELAKRKKLLSSERVVRVLDDFEMQVRLDDTVELVIYLHGAHEWVTLHVFRKLLQPGMTVVDVGAHSGEFSLCASANVGSDGLVLAFEPNPSTRNRLHVNLSLNEFSNVRVRSEALSDRTGTALLHFPSWASGNSGIATLIPQDDSSRTIEVQTTTLDSVFETMAHSALDLMKIDVEGLEREVLLGSHECLQKYRPTIVFEANDFSQVAESPTASLLYSGGYDLYGMRLAGSRCWLERLARGQDPSRYRETRQALNLVAIHPARLLSLRFPIAL
ncbi:MAG: FkbM family methyltransferase [Actinomycetota bacterium]